MVAVPPDDSDLTYVETAVRLEDLLPVTPEWMFAAPCGSTDPDAFFPGDAGTARPALRVCAGCPYKAPCLIWALRNDELGVWGGTTDEQRRALVVGVAAGGDPDLLAGAYLAAETAGQDFLEEAGRSPARRPGPVRPVDLR